ncbi:MAG: hypothetical protein KF791_08835 [Verrucomicrobiae bacterium]|nr:hypothetical protein [Verrucomicrobiae bacterium]
MSFLRQRRLGRLVLIAALGLAGLVATLAILNHRSETQERIAGLRAAGYPVTSVELDAWYEYPPADKNLATPLLNAMGAFRFDKDDTNLPTLGRYREEPAGSPWSPRALDAARECLAINSGALARLHAALERPKSRYPINLAKGYLATLAPLSIIRDAGRGLALEAIIAAKDNRPNEAVKALLLAQHLADTLEAEPVLISYLVAVSIRGGNLKAAETVLSQRGLSPTNLLQLQEAFLASAASTSPERALAGEMANFLDWTGRRTPNVRDLDVLGFDKPEMLAVYWALGLRHRDRRLAACYFDDLLAAQRLPADQRSAAARGVEARLSHTLSAGRHPLASMMRPSGGHTTAKHASDLTRLRAAAAACALERFRQNAGRLPESLEALVPAYMASVPTDAFTGRPLHFRQWDRGFVVYGVGENGADDGGRPSERRPKQGDRRFDDTFTVSW